MELILDTGNIKEIDSIIHEDIVIHAQVLSKDYESIIEEAKYINNLRNNIYVKIPVTKEGLREIRD